MHVETQIQREALLFSNVYCTATFLWCPKYSQLITTPSSARDALTAPNAGPTVGAAHTRDTTKQFFFFLNKKAATFGIIVQNLQISV